MMSLATPGCETEDKELPPALRLFKVLLASISIQRFLSRLQHDRSWLAGVKLRKLRMRTDGDWEFDMVAALTLDGIQGLGVRPQICCGCIQFNHHLSSSFHIAGKQSFFGKSKSIKRSISMYVSSFGGLNHWIIEREKWWKFMTFASTWKSVNPKFRQGNLIPFQHKCMNLKTGRQTRNRSAWSIFTNKGKTSRLPKNNKRKKTVLGSCFPNEVFLRTPLKAA